MRKLFALLAVFAFGFVGIGLADAATTTGSIIAPEMDEIVFGETELMAVYDDEDDINDDIVQWAVRKGDTCAGSSNTVFGNVDGFSDAYSWNGADFSAMIDTSVIDPGRYCFIFNPKDDSGENDVRESVLFWVADAHVGGGGHILDDNGGDLKKRKDMDDVSFGGDVWRVGAGAFMGSWDLVLHNVSSDDSLDKSTFTATEITALNLSSGATCEAMNFTANGTWNGTGGHSLIFRAGDSDAPASAGTDTVRLTVYSGMNGSGAVVYDTLSDYAGVSNCVGTARTELDNGNIVIES